MKKSIAAILIVLVTLCLLCGAVRYWAVSTSEVYFTESMGDYNSEQYPLVAEIFLEEIPSDADIVSFSYYDYWSEATDIYLELKFSSKNEMETYLSDLKGHSLQLSPTDREWFVTEQNPYDPTFTDLFCTFYNTTAGDKTYTGYIIDPAQTPSTVTFECNFAIISYSYEKLTVIQSRVGGYYRHNIHNYTPHYFLRFDVPLDKKHERLIYF